MEHKTKSKIQNKNKLGKNIVTDTNEMKSSLWNDNLENVKKYIDENNARPNKGEKTLKFWTDHQMQFYKNNKLNAEQTKIWEEFINCEKYKKYFLDNTSKWNYNLLSVENYIIKHGVSPGSSDKNKTTEETQKMGKWIHTQKQNYSADIDPKNATKEYKIIHAKWNDFMEKYENYIGRDEDKWIMNLQLFKQYIDENHKKPNKREGLNNKIPINIELEKKQKQTRTLGEWYATHNKTYNKILNKDKETSPMKCMIANKFDKLWKDFIEDPKYKNILTNKKSK